MPGCTIPIAVRLPRCPYDTMLDDLPRMRFQPRCAWGFSFHVAQSALYRLHVTGSCFRQRQVRSTCCGEVSWRISVAMSCQPRRSIRLCGHRFRSLEPEFCHARINSHLTKSRLNDAPRLCVMLQPKLFLRRPREEQSGTCLGARRMSTSTSAFGLAAHKHRRSSRKAIPNHIFGGAAFACLVLGCAWTLHANVFGANVYPQLSSANFDASVIRRQIAVRSALSAADTIIAALSESAPVISSPASVPPLLSVDDRIAAASRQSVEPAAPAEAPKLNSPETVDRADSYDEPFGLSTATVTKGAVLEKWLNLEREIDDERLVLRMCEENRASCQSRAALQLLAIVDSGRTLKGRARLGTINRAINLILKPVSDLALYGAEDVWSPPLATLAIGGGDCEDYAIAKFVALQEAGVSPDDLRIVILRDDRRDEDHAVVAARLDGNWLTLDNRHMAMVEDHNVRRYRPVFLVDRDGVKLYSDAPSTSEASRGYERAIGQIRR
jgi:predicted transglutaminase-like cysteine proteinase